MNKDIKTELKKIFGYNQFRLDREIFYKDEATVVVIMVFGMGIFPYILSAFKIIILTLILIHINIDSYKLEARGCRNVR